MIRCFRSSPKQTANHNVSKCKKEGPSPHMEASWRQEGEECAKDKCSRKPCRYSREPLREQVVSSSSQSGAQPTIFLKFILSQFHRIDSSYSGRQSPHP